MRRSPAEIARGEPVLTWAGLAAAINAGQIPLHIPTWAHILLAVAAILGTAHGDRRQVTPTGT
jgi:hypothetical protein